MHQVRPTTGDSNWFVNDRFGLFIHWGLYALPARHEWVKQREEIPGDVYDSKYFTRFDPDLYDPDVWAAAASDAGMKYFVVTTKHHDGFCLWDSKLTDYKATNTPARRDLIGPMAKAFRDRDMKVGFYHSLIDWHHPNFVIDDLHSMRNHPDRAELNKTREQQQYIEYLHGQVRELLTDYGKVDMLFYDFSYPAGSRGRAADSVGKGRRDWDSEALIKLTRQLQPDILVDDRLDLFDVPGGWDYRTPEQFMPRAWPTDEAGTKVVWETCQTFSGSWGYHRDESSWKSVDQLLRMLIEVVSKGGNLLLNVGPTGRGEFDDRALDRLRGMGAWMRRHGRAIYGCTAAPPEIPTPQNCCLTWNPQTRRLYVHILAWPFKQLSLDGLAGRVEYAQLLNDASEVFLREPTPHQLEMGGADAGAVVLDLPVEQPRVEIPVVELFLK
mgnify:CR=1 FL=1